MKWRHRRLGQVIINHLGVTAGQRRRPHAGRQTAAEGEPPPLIARTGSCRRRKPVMGGWSDLNDEYLKYKNNYWDSFKAKYSFWEILKFRFREQ